MEREGPEGVSRGEGRTNRPSSRAGFSRLGGRDAAWTEPPSASARGKHSCEITAAADTRFVDARKSPRCARCSRRGSFQERAHGFTSGHEAAGGVEHGLGDVTCARSAPDEVGKLGGDLGGGPASLSPRRKARIWTSLNFPRAVRFPIDDARRSRSSRNAGVHAPGTRNVVDVERNRFSIDNGDGRLIERLAQQRRL